MYFKLRFLQYIKKILNRDFLLKNLILNKEKLHSVEKLELIFKSDNYIRQSDYLYLLHTLELVFTQKPKLLFKKNKIKIKLNLSKNFQIYNGLNLLATLCSTKNKIKEVSYGIKSKNKFDLFFKNIDFKFINTKFSTINCQLSVNLDNFMNKESSISFLKSLFLNTK